MDPKIFIAIWNLIKLGNTLALNNEIFLNIQKKIHHLIIKKLLDIYSDMHKNGKRKLSSNGTISLSDPDDTFPGKQTLQHAGIIKKNV